MISVATNADLDAVGDLLAASYPPLLRPYYERAVLACVLPGMTTANPSLLSSGRFYLAHEDRNIVACGGWSAEEPGTGKTVNGLAHIRHFATHPKWTRRGPARSIMARCLSDAETDGMREMTYFAAKGSEPFYATCGFQIVGNIDLEMGRDAVLPATLMVRLLG